MKEIYMMFSIPDQIESGQKIYHKHWSFRHKLKEKYMWAIKARMVDEPTFIDDKRKVRITSIRKRRLDKDNLYFGAKPLVDALKSLGLIVDDDPEHLELEIEQEIDRKNPCTIIMIGGEVPYFQEEGK